MEKQIFNTNVDEVHDSEKERLGDMRWSGGFLYKYIKYKSGSGDLSGTAGDAVVYFDNGSAGDGWTNDEVTRDTSDGNGPFPAGVLVSDMTDNQFGWIQLTGRTTLNQTIAGTPSDGDPLAVGTDGALTRANDQGSGTASVVPVAVGMDVSEKTAVLNFPH